MATIRKNPKFPDRYNVIENGIKVLNGRSFSYSDAKRIADARTRLKKKKTVSKKTVNPRVIASKNKSYCAAKKRAEAATKKASQIYKAALKKAIKSNKK